PVRTLPVGGRKFIHAWRMGEGAASARRRSRRCAGPKSQSACTAFLNTQADRVFGSPLSPSSAGVLATGRGTAVLSNPGDDQSDCLQRAAEYRRKAEAARTLYVREKYLEMEQLWLLLAESYALEMRSDAFAKTRLN